MKFYRNLSHKNGFNGNLYQFDTVFCEIQKQEKFYESEVQPFVSDFISGKNASVILFGPTSSGKTYTLQGKSGINNHKGLLYRAVEDILSHTNQLFDQINFEDQNSPIINLKTTFRDSQSDDSQCINKNIALFVSSYMIFCENVFDLLAKGNIPSSNGQRGIRVEMN